jgi:hypothetical protein
MEYAQTQGEKLEVLDVSSVANSLRGLGYGVVKTPTLIAYGMSFKGLAEISCMVKERNSTHTNRNRNWKGISQPVCQ